MKNLFVNIRNLSLRDWLLIALILCILFNSIHHISSPAYRYYTEQCKKFDADYNNFVNKVRDSFVPALYSNQVYVIRRCVQEYLSTNAVVQSSDTFAVSSFLKSGLNSYTNSSTRCVNLNFKYGRFDDSQIFTYQDRVYFIGDDFYGSTITYISPTLVKTDDALYLNKFELPQTTLQKPASSSSSVRPFSFLGGK